MQRCNEREPSRTLYSHEASAPVRWTGRVRATAITSQPANTPDSLDRRVGLSTKATRKVLRAGGNGMVVRRPLRSARPPSPCGFASQHPKSQMHSFTHAPGLAVSRPISCFIKAIASGRIGCGLAASAE